MKKLKSWKELPIGGKILEAGNAKEFITGTWRTQRPEWYLEKCTHCMICWAFCPDSSIQVKDSKMTGIDYEHCKGCGICAQECPKDAIEMVTEER